MYNYIVYGQRRGEQTNSSNLNVDRSAFFEDEITGRVGRHHEGCGAVDHIRCVVQSTKRYSVTADHFAYAVDYGHITTYRPKKIPGLLSYRTTTLYTIATIVPHCFDVFAHMCIVISIIMQFINSTALNKIRRAASKCHSVLTKRLFFS